MDKIFDPLSNPHSLSEESFSDVSTRFRDVNNRVRLGFDFASFGRISKKVSVRLIQSVYLLEQLS